MGHHWMSTSDYVFYIFSFYNITLVTHEVMLCTDIYSDLANVLVPKQICEPIDETDK